MTAIVITFADILSLKDIEAVTDFLLFWFFIAGLVSRIFVLPKSVAISSKTLAVAPRTLDMNESYSTGGIYCLGASYD